LWEKKLNTDNILFSTLDDFTPHNV
jgi:hypothetical protein